MYPSVSGLLTIISVAGLVHSAIIPSDIKGCKRDDPKLNECVVTSINSLSPVFIGGEKDYAIPVLDPFVIENVVLSERNGQGLDVALNFKDVKVSGIKEAVVERTTTIDLQKQAVEIKVSIPALMLDAQYTADGKVLLLPIKGAGQANLTLGELKATFDSDFTLHKDKDGKEYAQLVNSKVDFTVEHFNIYLANLFNGDKTLETQMNIFLNENWKELLKEFGPILRETIRTIIFTVVNNVALKVPFEVLFPQ